VRQGTSFEADKPVDDSTRDTLLSSLAAQQARQDELTAMLRYTVRNPKPALASDRLTERESQSLDNLTGHLVDLDLEIVIDVGEDGWARLTYRHELLNLTPRPVTRIARHLWFEHTSGLVIAPLDERDRRVVIHRVHETATFTDFACQLSPPIQPGESAVVRFTCEGGQFVSNHYWRQTLPRHTRHVTISVRHRRGGRLRHCRAVEEQPDGSEQSIDALTWDYKEKDVIITLTRENLLPNQSVTLWWDVTHEPT
jgi:hypothetical protein